MSLQLAQQPAKGTVTFSAGNGFVYSPLPNANGDDSFVYQASDGKTLSNPATVSISIKPVEDAPVAIQDNNPAYNVFEGGELTIDASIGVLANDIADGGPGSLVAIPTSLPTQAASFTLNPDGSFVYHHNGQEVLAPTTDSFQYKVSDGKQESKPTSVTIALNPVNDPPQVVQGCSTAYQKVVFTGTLQASDVDNAPNELLFSLDPAIPGFAGPVTTANNAVVALTDVTTGEYTYTPDPDGDRVPDSFEFRVDDDQSFTTGTEKIIVARNVMLVGDSVTQGIVDAKVPSIANRVGYRKPLYDLLKDGRYAFDFVGNRFVGTNEPDFDPATEAYAGAKDEEIAFGGTDDETLTDFPGIYTSLISKPADVILLHIGTNDIYQDPTDTSSTAVESILTEIGRWENDTGNSVTLLLARIIDFNPLEPAIASYNSNVISAATAMGASIGPDRIFIVDQHSALLGSNGLPDPSLYGNNLHPNDTGYAIMAQTWQDTISSPGPGSPILEKCP